MSTHPHRHVTDAERRARLVTRHRLAPHTRTDDVVTIADDLVALHSTDPVTVYLSAAARMATPSLAPVATALYEDRTLLRHHAMRRTLWVFGHAHAALAHHAATVDVAAVQRRDLLRQAAAAGVDDPEGWYGDATDAVLALLAGRGPTPAREVGAALPGLAAQRLVLPGGGPQPAHTRVLLVLGFEGRVLRAEPLGTWINGQYRWAAADSWVPGGIGTVATADGDVRRAAAAGLARAHLRAVGPVTRDDLRWWAGWTVATTRTALADVGAVEVGLDGGGTGHLLPDDLGPVDDPGPSVALLPSLDPATMGWKARGWYLDPEHAPLLFDRNGNGGPAIWVDGAVAGTWVQRRDGTIATRLFTRVDRAARRAVDDAAERHRALLGEVRFATRFPAPVQPELLADP
ncbi:winged helix DNA-binding domain-containing protein [Pseudonocardia sp. ICBG1293]|uniref:winged helix DNA-binding domain-containing protein n=1 Tax=Pseudonocardia sp. ICBG1293 TaxID=2844382 RepID=UPI001CCEBC7F|nr:winged helix DNA-binding domain-containing protein [Pseudonocardia sp. ICBG1293]